MIFSSVKRVCCHIAGTRTGFDTSRGAGASFLRAYASVWNDNFGWGVNSLYPRTPSSRISTDGKQALQPNQELLQKYKAKLEQKAKSEGVGSIEELLKKLTRKAASQKHAPSGIKAFDEKTEVPNDNLLTGSPKHSAVKMGSSYTGLNTSLSKIMKMDRIMNETPDIIAQIWTAQHSTKECLSAVIPGETYKALLKRFQKCPQFVIPLPRENGHEFYFMQAHFHQLYFTSLLEYKTKGSQARPHLILTYYPELLETKGILLMRGELGNLPNDRVPLSLEDAKLMVYLFQQFYISGGPEKLRLVDTFNSAPNEFDYRKLLEEANKLS